MGVRSRITCPKCQSDVALTKTGKMSRHAAARGGWAKHGFGRSSMINICPASGTRPTDWEQLSPERVTGDG